MAAKRITQSAINWAAIAERVPAEQRSNFIVFKTKSDNYLRKVAALPENPPKIDWAFYKNKVPVPAVVDEMQKKYETFKIPVPDDTTGSVIAAEEKEAAASVQKFKQESASRMTHMESELKRFEAMIPMDQMTIEDFYYAYPEKALDPINNPTFWPHDEESQNTKDTDDHDH